MRKHVEDSYGIAYNLGCGNKKWENWINVDLHSDISDLKCDLRKLDVESDTADAVAAIHVLEHFYQWEAPALLSEWKRILKPGGKMILELPCLNKIFSYIADAVANSVKIQPFMTTLAIFGDPKHNAEAMCHKWGYFIESLVELLEEVGMKEIEVCVPRYHFPFRDMRIECKK